MSDIDFKQDARTAEALIRPYIRETPMDQSLYFSELTGCNVYFKDEHLQKTGSFKVRGALHKLLSLSDEEKQAGIVAASTGNHGAATAYGLQALNIKGMIVVPENASPSKVDAIKRWGAEVIAHGDDGVVSERYARQYALDHAMTYMSPYNDADIVRGQSTLGVEMVRQLNEIDAVFVALGGGGLISGIAGYLKSVQPDVKAIGCSPENSKVMIESIKAGEILDLPSEPTLSDGTSGGVEAESLTFPLCQMLVDDYVSVTEDEIKQSMNQFMETHHQLIEGAAAVPIAALIKQQEQWKGKNVVIVSCGGNISLDTLRAVLAA
jgi:threonine dehydratase